MSDNFAKGFNTVILKVRKVFSSRSGIVLFNTFFFFLKNLDSVAAILLLELTSPHLLPADGLSINFLPALHGIASKAGNLLSPCS